MDKMQNILEFIVVCSYGSSCLPKAVQEASKKNPEEILFRDRVGEAVKKMREIAIPFERMD